MHVAQCKDWDETVACYVYDFFFGLCMPLNIQTQSDSDLEETTDRYCTPKRTPLAVNTVEQPQSGSGNQALVNCHSWWVLVYGGPPAHPLMAVPLVLPLFDPASKQMSATRYNIMRTQGRDQHRLRSENGNQYMRMHKKWGFLTCRSVVAN